MKERAVVGKVVGLLREEVPLAYEAMIGERDEYMANSILGAVEAGPPPPGAGLTASSNPKGGLAMVGVVGIAHMDGIERRLQAKGWTTQAACNSGALPAKGREPALAGAL